MTDPNELKARGWKYYDIPWTPEEDWKELINLMHESNYEFLACTKRYDPVTNVISWRGQVFISPEGQTRLTRARRKLS